MKAVHEESASMLHGKIHMPLVLQSMDEHRRETLLSRELMPFISEHNSVLLICHMPPVIIYTMHTNVEAVAASSYANVVKMKHFPAIDVPWDYISSLYASKSFPIRM